MTYTTTRKKLVEEIQSNNQKHPIGRKQPIRKKQMIEQFPDLFKNITTKKDTEKKHKIQMETLSGNTESNTTHL